MTLPAPSLDDRKFQDIVDEAKRLIPRFCPEWTDHNVSDPGVAIIELMAWMSEMVIYRLNQVPDRLYVKFLELLGLQPFPASPARTDVVFELAAPPTEPVRVLAGTQVATGTSSDEPVVFSTDTELVLRQPEFSACLTRSAAGVVTDVWDGLRTGAASVVSFPSLLPGDALYLGFAEGLAGNLLRIDIVGFAEGAGIRPEDPPRAWQAWDGSDWIATRLISDSSDGFNTSGSVVLLLPPRHAAMPVGPVRAHWIRCVLTELRGQQRPYDRSPKLDSIAVVGMGGAVSAHHAEPAPAELLGVSSGEPGQVFQVRRAPVLPRRADEHVQVVRTGRRSLLEEETAASTDWNEVSDFSDTDPDDRVYTWSATTGEISFPPSIRQPAAAQGIDDRIDPSGSRRYGAVPPDGAQIWVTGYRYGGGRRGNVGSRTLTSLRTSVPSVAEVYNLDPATGGVDAESVDNAKLRGPQHLRGGSRAVTAADFERLTLEAARGVARARCVAPRSPADPVRVLVVPRLDVAPEALELTDLDLPEDLERAIVDHLEPRRLLTTRVAVGTPTYLGISIAARVRAAVTMRPETVRTAAESLLYAYVNPVVGGPQGLGWPFLRELNIGEVFGLLGGVPGIVGVEEVIFFLADLTQRRGTSRVREERTGNVVTLPDGSLFASCDHRVVVVQ
ncbi:putative baseplate assembly protein [Acidothermaceae bacterium B102]|nr:putative baseplate assembly protein [Acidothermaceae bacterium B102]